jgi:hypothetical protein
MEHQLKSFWLDFGLAVVSWSGGSRSANVTIFGPCTGQCQLGI